MPRDPQKAKERKRRYLQRIKIAKYGPEAADLNMRGRHGNQARGPRNGRWNNGHMRTSHGYIAIAVPVGHHLRQAHGYAYEHNLVAEQILGRSLRNQEVVHHKNGILDDNRSQNLLILTRTEHASLHARAPNIRDSHGRFLPGPKGSRSFGVA